MSRFLLECGDETRAYLEDIVDEMARIAAISRDEAVARVNSFWRGRAFLGGEDLILHELPDYWAMLIYFEDVLDWSPTADRSDWVPRPVPPRGFGFWPDES